MKCLPTGKAATGSMRGLQSGILARPMEQLPRFHGGTVTTQMRNLYRCGWWGDDNWEMVGKTTVSAKLCLRKDTFVTHFSSVWESCHNQLMLPTEHAFWPHWFRNFQCARSSSMLHRRNLPLQLSSEDFPRSNLSN